MKLKFLKTLRNRNQSFNHEGLLDALAKKDDKNPSESGGGGPKHCQTGIVHDKEVRSNVKIPQTKNKKIIPPLSSIEKGDKIGETERGLISSDIDSKASRTTPKSSNQRYKKSVSYKEKLVIAEKIKKETEDKKVDQMLQRNRDIWEKTEKLKFKVGCLDYIRLMLPPFFDKKYGKKDIFLEVRSPRPQKKPETNFFNFVF